VETTLSFSLHLKLTYVLGIFVGIAMLERWGSGSLIVTGRVASEDHTARGMYIIPIVRVNDRGMRDRSFGNPSSFVGGWCDWICMLVVIKDSSDH
jgi:hypothetical protein